MDLESIVTLQGIVNQSPSVEETRVRARTSSEPIKLFYGETYDAYGNPVDSFKYYFSTGNEEQLQHYCLEIANLIFKFIPTSFNDCIFEELKLWQNKYLVS